MKSRARGFGAARGDAPVESDPFAELADIFEIELKFDPQFQEAVPVQPTAARPIGSNRRTGVDVMQNELERELEAAFETDMKSGPRSQEIVVPRPSRLAVDLRRPTNLKTSPARPGGQHRKVAEPLPTHLTDEEIDDELESVLRSLSTPAKPRDRIVVETQSFAPERAMDDHAHYPVHVEVDEFEELIRSELAVIRPAVAMRSNAPQRSVSPAEETFDEPDFDDAFAANPVPYVRSAKARGNWKRGLAGGASALVLLLVAGAGYMAWQNSSTGVDGTVDSLLIKADAEPYKIAPKDPGGRAYPNQNKAVYDRVASPKKDGDTPSQQALLRNAEEPMSLPAEEERTYADGLPGVELGDGVAEAEKDDTRVTSATETAEADAEPALQPIKVRTMTVGPDGRLVASSAPTAKPAPVVSPIQAELPALKAKKGRTEASADSAAEPPAAARAADPIEVASLTPLAPAAPTAAPQPVSEAQPSTAVTTSELVQTASAMPTTGYFVQISSQPSEAAAQQSMNSLSSRHASIFAGRPIGIQSAAIPNKGTYYRVRIAAASKSEAASLCARLKSAGATCFVTR